MTVVLLGARIGLNASALLMIGLALHAATGVVEHSSRSALRWSVILLATGLLLLLVLRLYILAAQISAGADPLDPARFDLVWLVLGPSTLMMAAGAIVAASGFVLGLRPATGLGALLLSVGFGLTGHAQSLENSGFASGLVAAHVAIAGFWIAAPLTLFPRADVTNTSLVGRLRRFSRIATVAVPLLALIGIWLAWRFEVSPSSVMGQPYGRLLLAKLLIALAAMGIGAINKVILTPRLLSAPATGRRWLRVTLIVEAALFGCAVIAVSAATTIAGPAN